MEAARSTGNFNRRITVADSNNIIAILDMNAVNSKYQIFEEDYLIEFQAVLEDLKITIGLMSLAEAPWPNINALMGESEKMAEIARVRTQGQKIGLGLYVATGNGPWQYESEVVLQNQGGSETHVPILVPFLSSNETLLMAGNFKLGVRIEPKWNQPLRANDYLVIKGTWRQVVSFSEIKKNDLALVALGDRVQILESLLAVVGNPNPTFKQKLITGVAGAAGSSNAIPHGLDASKIIGVQVIVGKTSASGVGLYPASLWPDGEFGWYYDAVNIYLDIGVLAIALAGSEFAFLVSYQD